MPRIAFIVPADYCESCRHNVAIMPHMPTTRVCTLYKDEFGAYPIIGSTGDLKRWPECLEGEALAGSPESE